MQDPKLGRALSGKNTPSVLEKEALFDQVYARVEIKTPARRGLRPFFWLASTGLAAFAVFVLVKPAGLENEQDAFGARGGHAQGGVFDFELQCVGEESRSPCKSGDKLAVRVHAPKERFFAAFARRADGTVIWYWPSAADGKSLPASKLASVDAHAQAVLLDAAHTPGRYAVYGVLSKRALTRDEIKQALGAEFRGNAETLVKRHTLTVAAP